MKQFSFLAYLLVILSCSAQTKPSATGSMADQLVVHYNNKHYDSIFYLFSREMKEALPLKNTTDFFLNMQSEAGAIEKYKFIDKKDGFDRYRGDFVKGIYWLNVAQGNKGEITGLYFYEYDGPGDKPSMLRNTTKLSLPFTGEWFVFWGGDTKEQNYHVISRSQKNAFDFVIAGGSGNTFKTDGKHNEDYYAFGQSLTAPCDAEVVMVTDGIKDNVPGEMNKEQITGNTVVLKTMNNEYLLFAHFKQNSIQVTKGARIKKGQLLGLCGNSGNSSEPHLHFHIQDKENMIGSTGVKCYFEKLKVNDIIKKDYSPVKGERIKNAD
jgi:murein DD-endopeptidase MepM/ murein hydrolase activator NlpD